MSYENLLTDKCNIYRLQTKQSEGGYGVPTQDTEYYYNDVPDAENVKCYFAKADPFVLYNQPGIKVEETVLIHFLPSASIKLGDIVEKGGIRYLLQIPKDFRGHHVEVKAVRK